MNNLPDDGVHVEFFRVEPGKPGLNSLVVKTPIPIFSPATFDDYREEAQCVIRLLTGESKPDDAKRVAGASYNRMGLDTFLAALTYELMKQ